MILWRVVSKRFQDQPLDGAGAKLHGGRWNYQGAAVLYAATSKSQALLEVLTDASYSRHDYVATPIVVPPSVPYGRVDIAELPANWPEKTTFAWTQGLGAEWLKQKKFAFQLVPSSIVYGEYIALINPSHPDFTKIIPVPSESIFWDDRPFKESRIMTVEAHKDVFLCHASEDKISIVEPLFRALFSEGISCWYDNAEVKWGDSITAKVNEGLSKSEYVIVVLSENFMKKNWPKRELMAALNKESSIGRVVVLPLLVGDASFRSHVQDEFFLQSDKLYVEWKDNPQEIAGLMRDRLGLA